VETGDLAGALISAVIKKVFPKMTPAASATNNQMWQDISLSVAGTRARDYLHALCIVKHGQILPYNDNTWLSLKIVRG